MRRFPRAGSAFALCTVIGLSTVDLSASIGAPVATAATAEGSDAALALVPDSRATHRAARSGDWSTGSTWEGGVAPGNAARVVIPAGIEVRVDREIEARLKTVRIDGRLTFATHRDTALSVGTLVSSAQGELRIGTAADPVKASATARLTFLDDGPIDRSWDPRQLSRGAVLMGPVRMHGQAKTAWLVLKKQPKSGTRKLRLAKRPRNWGVGDTLVVAGTDPEDHASDEIATISSVNGRGVQLVGPLTRDHVAPAAGLDVHVANVSRNVQITSENTATLGRRGHVMFRHNLDVDVRYVEFRGLGRTNKRISLDDTAFPDLEEDGSFVRGPENNIRGRYSVHFHRGGTNAATSPARVSGSSVVGDPGWAFVNHSSNVDFVDNVSYDVVGGAYQTEAGNEVGSFIGNIAIRTVNPDDPMADPSAEAALIDIREEFQDFAFQGDGFWIHGGGVKVDGNVVSGASGHAYVYWPEGLIEAHLGRIKADKSQVPNSDLLAGVDQLDTWWIPIASAAGNTAYSATKGLVTYYLHTSFLDPDDPRDRGYVPQAYRDTLDSTFEGFTIWNMRGPGMEFLYTENITVKDSRIVGTGKKGSIGIDANHFHMLEDLSFRGLVIEGFDVGFDVPSNGTVRIADLTMRNNLDIRIREPQFSREEPETIGAAGRDMEIRDISFRNKASTPIKMVADFSLAGEIQDGFDEDPFDINKDLFYFLMTDRIMLTTGSLRDARLYFDAQAANFVPITPKNRGDGEDGESIPQRFVNKTNRQLQDAYGTSFGGKLLPAEAVNDPDIVGGKVVNRDSRR